MSGRESVREIEARARAISEAADMACNQWNLAKRTQHWAAMTPVFKEIWDNLKGLSADEFKRADEARKIEHLVGY